MTDNEIDSLTDVQVIKRVIGDDLTAGEIMAMKAEERQGFARECRASMRAGVSSKPEGLEVVQQKIA